MKQDQYKKSFDLFIYKAMRREEVKEAVKDGLKVVGYAFAFIFTMYALAMLMYVIS